MVSSRSLTRGFIAALALTAGLLAGCATLDEKQSEWIFRPTREAWRGTEYAAVGMDERWIEFTSHITQQPTRLHALWLPQQRTDAPVLLYLHGARWDLRGSAHRMRRMHELGFAVLGVDYRGFGKSSDELPTEAKAYEDAAQTWAWMQREFSARPRYVFGHSLGGAVAVNLAASVMDEAGLIVEGSFPSIPDVVATYRWGFLPVGPLVTQRFDAASRIARVGSPVLVVHGTADSVIAPELGQRLFKQASAPKRFVAVEGGSHHNTNALGQAQYRQALADLFGLGKSPVTARQESGESQPPVRRSPG